MAKRIYPEDFDSLPIGSLISQVYMPAVCEDWEWGDLFIWPKQPIWRHIVKSSNSWEQYVAYSNMRKFKYFNAIEEGRDYYWERLHEGEMFFGDFWTGHPGCEVYLEGIDE